MNQDVHRSLISLEEHGIDIAERLIWLIGDIDSDQISGVARQITFLSSRTRFPAEYTDPIKLFLSSPGGDTEYMMLLYDVITTCTADIITIGSGEIASAASLLLVCGDKRYVTENCLVMTHAASVSLEGSDEEVAAAAESILRQSDKYWKLLGRHSNRPASWWYKKSKQSGELWIDAEKLLECGAIDGIIPTSRELDPIPKRRLKAVVREVELELEGEEDDG